MYVQNNKAKNFSQSILINAFFLISEFISEKNKDINLVLSDSMSVNHSKLDDKTYFKAGQLLMFLYVFSIINLTRDNIRYLNGTFFLRLSNKNFCPQSCIKSDAESIAQHMIDKSAYTKDLFLYDFNSVNSDYQKNVSDFKRGFKICYETFLYEKINIMKFLEDNELESVCCTFTNNLKLLSLRDLNMQQNFIELKTSRSYIPNRMIENVLTIKDDKDKFLESSIKLLDFLSENSLIGINDNGEFETIWIKYKDNKLTPIGIEGIYISMYFSYVSRLTQSRYYYQSSKSSLLPLFHLSKLHYKELISDDKILSSLYLLNKYMKYDKLDNFIKHHPDLFIKVPDSYKKKCSLQADKLILQCIINNSIDVIKSLMLV